MVCKPRGMETEMGQYRSLASCWMASYILKNLWHVLLSLTLCKCTTCHTRLIRTRPSPP